MSGDFPVVLESARYALPAGGDPVKATLFAGQDITAAIEVNLVQPGSVFNLDSPVRVAETRSSGISIRAATSNFNAVASTASSLTVGPAIVNSVQALEQAGAIAELVDGQVARITIPPGFAGAGYDADNPPRVTIGLPESVQATAAVTGLANGRVVAINVTAGGTGYTTAPIVTLSPPTERGQTAEATAVVSAAAPGAAGGGSVSSIIVTTPGSGYTRPAAVTIRAVGAGTGTGATATADIAGSLATGSVQITNRGSGYVPNTTVNLTIRGTGTGAVGIANINSSGSVESVVITNGGDGYSLSGTEISFPIPPVNASPKVATARAIVDPATTRIVRYEIVDPGAGYGAVPSVTISAPLPVYNATRPIAAVDSVGRVTGVDFAFGAGLKILVTGVSRASNSITSAIVQNNGGGSGYAAGDLVNVDSGSSGKGQSAQFRVLEVDNSGSVLRMDLVTGGGGYGQGEVLTHAGSAGRGYGYKTAPRVWIGRPTSPDGIQAEAVAIIDNAGRISGVTVTKAGTGYAKAPIVTIEAVSPVAQAETVRFNTRVGASNYTINLADDPSTTDVGRTTLLVTNAGSLAGNLAGTVAAGSVVIESRQGDVLLEGSVFAEKQSYLLQSNPEDQVLAPFRLTTSAAGSSVPTGWIKGGTVAVTLANDLDTPIAGAVAFNEVSLRTQIDSLRIRAARRSGTAISDPFPYQLSVSEFVDNYPAATPPGGDANGDISIDAVAASSFPIQLQATGDMDFNAALSTAGGLSVFGVKTFTVTAPLATTQGQIKIEAASIKVGTSLKVTDVRADESRQDIILSAADGDITMDGGLISARNRVVLNQRKRLPNVKTYASLDSKQTIADNSVASMSVTVPVNAVSDNVDVTLNITHTSLADLSATLIAPDNTRVQLFATKTLTGKDLTDTRFDTETTATLTTGQAPYSGSFRPAVSLASLYRKAPAGKWTVEVKDSVSGGVGTIDGFSVSLRDPEGLPSGTISGTSRIKADTLVIDGDGSVGVPDLLMGEAGAYLLTDVNTVIGYVGGSFAVSDISDLNISSLRAGGLVALRAEGVDPMVDKLGQTTSAALRGTLTDVTGIDLTAPNGSIAIDLNTSNTIVVGNVDGLRLPQSIRGSRLPSMVAAGSVTIRSVGGSTGGDFVVMDAPLAGSSARPVRFATSVVAANVNYNAGTPGIYASTITAKSNGAAPPTLFGAVVPTLRLGDRILVANPTAGGDRMNGIYAVTRIGDAFTPFQLMRVTDGDTAPELPSNSVVAVLEGSEAGVFYRISYAALGATPFGLAAIRVVPIGLKTAIGSVDPSDALRFVVSTTDGTNTNPGSLGKMMRLRQANVPIQNDARAAEFLFASSIVTPIKLTQELPLIGKPFSIDGTLRYPGGANGNGIAIDGSRIDTTRTGGAVGLGTIVDGITFTAESGGATADAAGSLANVVLGGFNQGSAVIVDGAPNVTLDSLVLGEDFSGNRLGNLRGIVVKSAAAGVTVSKNRISSTGGAAVSLQESVSDVKMFGNTIGRNGRDNVIGVEVTTSKANTIGDYKSMPNTIRFNSIGIKLAGLGSTKVVNAVITENATDGILITSGANAIGLGNNESPPAADASANQIAINKGWGVRIAADTDVAARLLAKQQIIQGNFFVVPETASGDRTKENTLGAVGLSARLTAPATKYEGENGSLVPRSSGDPALIGIDPSGNYHFGVGDNLGPSLSLLAVVGNSGEETKPPEATSASISLTGSAAGVTKAFVLKLEDKGSGLLAPTINKAAFTVSRDGLLLTEGNDYTFSWSGTPAATLRFESPAPTMFALGTYQITATAKNGLPLGPGTYSGGLLTDKVNNSLRGGSANFTIRLVGAGSPTEVVAVAGDADATLTWIPPINSGEADILRYAVQQSVDSGSTWQDVVDTDSPVTTATVDRLSNGLTYNFRVAAVTAAGRGAWSPQSNSVKPGFLVASAPLSVQATPSDARINLSWVVPSSNGGKPIFDYVIESSIDGGRTWSTVVDGVTAATTASVTGLTNGSAYVFRVAAVNAVGRGDWSQLSATVIPFGPASAPRSVTAVGGNGQATLSWTAPSSDGGRAVTDYLLQASVDAGRTWTTVVDTVSTATAATVTGLTNGISYMFRVAAQTAAGPGAWSAASTAIPRSVASSPQSLVVTAGDGRAMLTWLAPLSTSGSPVTDYVIQSSVDNGRNWNTVVDGSSAVTNAAVPGLTNGTTYVFRVAALTAAGTGAWTAASTGVTPRGPATAPQNVQATVADGRVVVTWNAPTSLGGSVLRDYVVQSSTNGGVSWSNVVDGVSTATTATVTGLVNGTAYVFRVAAITDHATGSFSAVTAAVVPLDAPGAITGLQVQTGTRQMVLSWRAPTNNGGRPVIDYRIEYRAGGSAAWVPYSRAASSATTATITGLAANTGYLFRVRAVTDFASGQAVETTEPSVMILSPTRVTGRAANGSVALTWLPPKVPRTMRVIDYRVQYSINGVTWITVADGVSAASRTTIRGLTNGTSYFFRVAAVTARGVGGYSASSARLTPVAPRRR